LASTYTVPERVNEGVGVGVGGIGVLVGGTGVFVGGTGVLVGGIGVLVGRTGVLVGGTGVLVGGIGVLVGGGIRVGVGVAIGRDSCQMVVTMLLPMTRLNFT